ncbi:hypothetical protein JAO76_15490 [Pontibacter sp. BT310]|uniref:Small EDRK-rich factor-like N-terminal domain-containing protein n=1 Tax=Pontibacter populi TaxID=890055 RepID=A0ABS6XEP4_9BACT|nr:MULTISPECIES: hypothetical protein [Pontibacter]MBJ6119613.1 hypothetical protein [Pontibacter sp. BT310]MBR0572040.1 hypothetical protein [Microvirga sp. STS03]MBW3366466.1 hypothetical protein [Pontibacter populi]
MSTRARDQQKKQRQKEFKERKEHQQALKAAAIKGKRQSAGNEDGMASPPKTED